MCTTGGQSFNTFTKRIWINDLGALCDITNHDMGLYDLTDTDKLVQGSSGSMSATKKVNFVQS